MKAIVEKEWPLWCTMLYLAFSAYEFIQAILLERGKGEHTRYHGKNIELSLDVHQE